MVHALAAQLAGAGGVLVDPLLVAQVIKERTAPQRERLIGGGQRIDPALFLDSLRGLLTACGELRQIHGVGGCVEVVPGRLTHDRRRHLRGVGPVTQRTSQIGDVGLQAGGGARRWIITPHCVNQTIDRHDAALCQQQHRQDCPLFRGTDVDRRAGMHHLQWSEQAIVHRRSLNARARYDEHYPRVSCGVHTPSKSLPIRAATPSGSSQPTPSKKNVLSG